MKQRCVMFLLPSLDPFLLLVLLWAILKPIPSRPLPCGTQGCDRQGAGQEGLWVQMAVHEPGGRTRGPLSSLAILLSEALTSSEPQSSFATCRKGIGQSRESITTEVSCVTVHPFGLVIFCSHHRLPACLLCPPLSSAPPSL